MFCQIKRKDMLLLYPQATKLHSYDTLKNVLNKKRTKPNGFVRYL